MRVVLLAIGMMAFAQAAAAFPACAPPAEFSEVPITRVEPNGVLVASDGRAIVPEGLLLPGGARDHAPQFLADQAISQLTDLARGRSIVAAASPPKQDRYGRVRAQIFFTDDDRENWLQVAMLRRGLARVLIAPDRRECVTELYAAEAEARGKRNGIWANAAYAIRPAASISLADLGTFQIVEGRVTNATLRSGRAYINFGADWKTDFTASIAPEDMKAFRAVNLDPESFAGKLIRVRGVIEKMNGPEIELAGPGSVELLPDLRPAQR